MDKIPTAEELFKKYSTLYHFEEGSPEYLIDKEDFQDALIEFAKMHVKVALKEATDTAEVDFNDDTFRNNFLNAYPDTNIK